MTATFAATIRMKTGPLAGRTVYPPHFQSAEAKSLTSKDIRASNRAAVAKIKARALRVYGGKCDVVKLRAVG